MKVVFADSFFKSLKKMVNREKWYWKVWDFFRYDLPRGVKNILFFWKVIWNFRSWDYSYQMKILKRSLEPLHDSILKGYEVDVPRLKKAEKIARILQLLENLNEDKYIDIAEEKLGYEVNTDYLFVEEEPEEVSEKNKLIFKEARKIEEQEWEELFRILKGQNHTHYQMLHDRIKIEKGEAPDDLWESWFDGTGIKGWWT